MEDKKIDEVLQFWFGTDPAVDYPKDRLPMWFKEGPRYDDTIRMKFDAVYRAAVRGESDAWAESGRGRLALIILLDQFSRHLERGRPESFEHDSKALGLAREGVRKGEDRKLRLAERIFFYMPYMHAEDLEVQNAGVELYEKLSREAPAGLKPFFEENLDYAKRHRDIVKTFGRFPHRNEILGRNTTPAEREFLKQPGSSF